MKWWSWNWDHVKTRELSVPYLSITRWRRGWVTLYRLESATSVEWRLYFPFNISIGFQR